MRHRLVLLFKNGKVVILYSLCPILNYRLIKKQNPKLPMEKKHTFKCLQEQLIISSQLFKFQFS